jgi:tryptophanyl-tRNA synthetase
MSTGENFVLTSAEVAAPVIDPWNNVVQEDLAPFIEYHKLQTTAEVQELLSDSQFAPLAKSAVSAIELTSEVVDTLRSNPSSVVAISGFDTAGDLHFGNLVVLKQLMILGSKGCQIRIPLADLEAIAARGDEVAASKKRAQSTMLPNLIQLGFKAESVYIRSSISGILDLMALVSRGTSPEKLEQIYGRKLNGPETFSLTFMAADLLRPQTEGIKHTIAIYGIDEAPHIKAINQIAADIGFDPIVGIFNPLVPSRRNASIKMSKSLQKKDANLSLTSSPEEVRDDVANYDVQDPCMVKSLRHHFLIGSVLRKDTTECDLECKGCKRESSAAMFGFMSSKQIIQKLANT